MHSFCIHSNVALKQLRHAAQWVFFLTPCTFFICAPTHALRASKADDRTPSFRRIATPGHVLAAWKYSPNVRPRSGSSNPGPGCTSGMVLRIAPNEEACAEQGKSYLSRECSAGCVWTAAFTGQHGGCFRSIACCCVSQAVRERLLKKAGKRAHLCAIRC